MKIARVRVRGLLLGFLLASVGCVLLRPESGTVTASATTAGIPVSNEKNFTVQVYSIADAALPLWDTPQCIEGTTLLPGETQTFPWAAVYQFSPLPSLCRTMWWRDGTCAFGTDDGPRGRLTVTR